jgi:vanillate O-demethylase monooxygenase subunit
MFLRNAWYVAARDEEVTRVQHAATILGERVVLYRMIDGNPVALEDACPHRKVPLSLGRIVGDAIECGYHGLVFDCSGRCTRVPGQDKIPPGARVRSYPVVSRHGLVWIWMGEPARANASDIFPVDHADDPAWGSDSGGVMTVACNYLYITDNLLDPSHVAWVHRSSFGNSDCEDEPIKAEISAEGVIAARWMHDVEVAPFYAPHVAFKGRCDRLQHYEVRFPSHAIIRSVLAPAGTGGAGEPVHPDALLMDSYNFLTPIDAVRTRYYWFQMRNFSPRDGALTKALDDGVHRVFSEDRLLLEAEQQGFEHQATPKIDLAADRAQLLFRRRLARMIAEEAKPAAAAQGEPSAISAAAAELRRDA